MLLSTFGDAGQFWKWFSEKQILHAALVTLRQRNPRTIYHEVGIVPHPLRLVLACSLRQ